MLTAHKQTVSARLSESEQEDLTGFLADYQRQQDVIFKSFREFLAHLSVNGLSTTENNEESIKVADIKAVAITYSESNNLAPELTAIEIVNHALTSEPKTIEVEKIVEVDKIIEKEIEKEITVEKQLTENQFLLEINDNQMSVLKTINSNRMEQNKRRDIDVVETIPQTLLKAFFNKGNLYNWGGEFYTGLR